MEENLILGEKLFVNIAGKPIAYSTTCSIEMSAETIDTSNKESGQWVSSLPGKCSWSISTDALITKAVGKESLDAVFTAFTARQAVEITFVQKDTAETTLYSGKAFITACNVNANNGEVASMSVTLTGTGELKKGAAA